MAFLIANADNTISLFPKRDGVLTEPDSFSVVITDAEDADVTIAAEPAWVADGVYLNINEDEITDEMIGTQLKVVWTFVIDGQTGTAVANYDVLERSVDGFISLADAKSYIGGLTDTSDDATIELLIDAATSAISEKIGYEIISPERIETQSYISFGENIIYPNCCKNITAVKRADNTNLLYTVVNGRRTTDFVRWVVVENTDDEIFVTGTYGFKSVPAAIQQACRITVKMWFERDRTTFVSGIDLTTGFLERPRAIPVTALGLLEPYIKRGRL